MAKTKDFAQATKRVENITRLITVGEKTADLDVKLDFDCKKNTFKISTKITTNHVSFDSNEHNDALVDQLGEMVSQAIKLANKHREEYNAAPETNQIPLDFGQAA